MSRDYTLFLKDILESIIAIEGFIESLSYADFLKDDKTASAVVRKIEIIGEAAKNIPKETRKKYKTIPWSDMAGMRDKIIHSYFGIDFEIVWEVISKNLPALKSEINAILLDLKKQ